MMPPAAAVETVGTGTDLLLIHGTGTDRESWLPLMGLLRPRMRVTAYHRRGTAGWPAADGRAPATVAEHAADLADLVGRLGGGPAWLFGASFGATVALELACQRPELVRGCALFEPALAEDDGAPPVASAMLAELERWIRCGEPERGAESFHRRVLSEGVWRRLTPAARARARGMWRHVHGDLAATAAYRVRHAELGALEAPFLLLRGGRSRPEFEGPLRALAAALPRARYRVVERAGHQRFTLAWRDLASAVSELVALG